MRGEGPRWGPPRADRAGRRDPPAYATSDNVGRNYPQDSLRSCLPSRNGRISVGQLRWVPFTAGVGICRKEKLPCAVALARGSCHCRCAPQFGADRAERVCCLARWVDPPQRADRGETRGPALSAQTVAESMSARTQSKNLCVLTPFNLSAPTSSALPLSLKLRHAYFSLLCPMSLGKSPLV